MTEHDPIRDAIKLVRNQALGEVRDLVNTLQIDKAKADPAWDGTHQFIQGHRAARRQIYAAIERLMGCRL